MKSDLKLHTPTPWTVEAGFVGADMQTFLCRPGCDGIRAWTEQDICDFFFAVKAVNMHERLVNALRNMLTADIVNVEYVQALLKEATDA